MQGHREVVSALQHEADFLIASSTEIVGENPGPGAISGHPQMAMIEAVVKNPQVQPEQLARDFVSQAARLGHREEPREDINPTLSAFATRSWGAVHKGLDQLGRDLAAQYRSAPDGEAWMKGLLQRLEGAMTIPNGKNRPDFDLIDVVSRMGGSQELQKACQDATLAHFAGETDYNGHRYNFTGHSPLATFLPVHNEKLQHQLQQAAADALEPCFTVARRETVSYNSDLVYLQFLYRRGQLRGLATEKIAPLLRDLATFHPLSEACLTGEIPIWKEASPLNALPLPEQTQRQRACLESMRGYLTPDFMESAGIREIWKNRERECNESWKAYQEAPHQPQDWKAFVDLIWDAQANQAWKAARAELEQRLAT